MWAIGCIFAEILSGRPIFTCNADQNKFASPYHPQQFQRLALGQHPFYYKYKSILIVQFKYIFFWVLSFYRVATGEAKSVFLGWKWSKVSFFFAPRRFCTKIFLHWLILKIFFFFNFLYFIVSLFFLLSLLPLTLTLGL